MGGGHFGLAAPYHTGFEVPCLVEPECRDNAQQLVNKQVFDMYNLMVFFHDFDPRYFESKRETYKKDTSPFLACLQEGRNQAITHRGIKTS